MKRLLSLFTLIVFCFSSLNSYAVNLTSDAINRTSISNLLSVSQPFAPLVIKGLKLYADDPFKFDFMVDEGGLKHGDAQLKEEAQKLINYFLVSLTIPDNDLWVNLSPYEKDRIVTSELGSTGMGQDMLNQDYILKQLASSLTFPESETGKAYWQSMSGVGANNHSPVNNFNRVWIVPDKAVVYTDTDKAYVGEATLKVMVEEDYLAMQKNNGRFDTSRSLSVPPRAERIETNGTLSDRSATAFKTHILPALTKEVNEGANFASLRQMYKSLILAAWFKKHLKENVINKLYADKKKIDGVNTADPQIKEKIYNQYLASCKKGIYNIVERERTINKITKRAYFSGGLQLAVSPEDVPLSKASAGTTSADAVISGKMENAGNDDIGSEDGAVRPLEIAGYRYGLAYYADGKHQIRTSRQSLTKHLEAFRARLPEGKITVKRVQHFIDGHETLHILKRELMKYDSEVASIDKTTEEALANVVGAAFADNHAIVPPQLLYAVKILERALNKKFAERHKPAITDFLEFIQNLNPYDSKDPKSLEVLLQDIDIDVVVEDATLAELKALQEKVKGGESEAVAAGSDSVSAASAPQAAPLASKIAAQRCTQGREDYQNSLLFGDNSAAKIESAIENFTVAIKGGILAAYFERAKCLYLQARVDEAKSDLIKYVLLMLDKGGSFLERCRARGYDVTSNTALAEAFLKQFEEEIFESSPQAVRAYNFRGEVYLGYGQYGKAIVEFRKALRIDPGDAQAIANMAQASSLAHAVANTDAPKVITSDPQAAAVCIGRGNAYLAHKEYDEANNAYREAIRLDPGNSVAYTGLGNVCMEQNNYPQAIGYYDQAVTHDPNNYDAFHNRGNARLKQGDYSKAVADLDYAIEGYRDAWLVSVNDSAVNNSLVFAYIHRGEAYSRLFNHGKAIEDFQEALSIDSDNTRAKAGLSAAHYSRGLVYFRQDDYANAVPDFAATIAINPKYPLAHRQLGFCYLMQENYNSSIANFRQAIALDKDDAIAKKGLSCVCNNRGSGYNNQSEHTKAIIDFEEAFANDRNNATAKANLVIALTNRASVYLKQGKRSEAISDLTKVLEIEPDDVAAKDKLKSAVSDTGLAQEKPMAAPAAVPASLPQILTRQDVQRQIEELFKIIGTDAAANNARFSKANPIWWALSNNTVLTLSPSQARHLLEVLTGIVGSDAAANGARWAIAGLINKALVNDRSLRLSQGQVRSLLGVLAVIVGNDMHAKLAREAVNHAAEEAQKTDKAVRFNGAIILPPSDKSVQYVSTDVPVSPVAASIARGNAYLAHKEYDEANNAYREAIRLDPGNSVAYTGLGNVCMEQNNYPQAIGYYDQAVTHDPNNYDALHNRGNAHLRQGQQGDYTAAIADLDKAIEGYKKSLAFGTNGIAGNASLAIAYIHRGEAYSRLSNEGKAIADFQEALKIEPDNSRAQLGMELALFVGGSPLVVPEPVAAPAPKPRPGKDIAELKARLGLAKGPAAAPVPAQIPAGLDIQKLTEELLEIKGDDDKANYARASMADKIRLDMNSNKSRTLPPDQLLRLLTAQSRIIGGPGSPTLARMSIGGVIDQALSNDPNRMHSAFKVLAGIVGVDRTANWSRGTFLLTIRHFFTNDQSLTLNRDQVQILFNILNNTGIHGYCNISSLIAEIIAQATHNDRSLVLLPDQAQSLFKVFISITGIDYEANWLRAYVAEAIRWDMCNDKSLIMLPDQVQSFLKAFTDVTGAADTANWIKAYIVNAIWQAMVNDPSLVLSSGEIQILSESLTGVIDTDFGAQKLREAIERAIQRSRKNEKTEVRGGDAIQAPASKEPDQPAPAGENAAAPVVGVGDISIDTAAATSEGRTLLEKGDYRGAIASYKKAIENGDNNAETYADLGAALLHLGEFDKAVICFKRVLKIDPTCVVAYTNMGFALLAKNDYPGVISNYEIAVALGDNRVETYVNMGVAYLHLGRYGEAVKSLESALTICSDAQIRFKVQDYLNRARAAAAPVDTPAPADANPMDKFIDRDFRQAHSDGSIITMLQDALGSMDEDLRAMALANPELGIALGRDILGKVAAGMPASAEGDFFQRGISVSADPVMITRSEVEGAGLRWRDFCAKLVGGNVIGKVRNKSREILLPANSDLSATGEIAEALGADFTAILPVLQKAMAQAQGVSHVKPVTIAGIIHGLFVVHADGRRAIYVNHDELQNHLGDIARYMGVKSVTLEQARRFIDGHETFHAFVHWLSEHYKGFKGISSAQEEKLADMLGKVFVYGYSKAVELELITFFEDLDYELKTNFSTLLKASPASIEGFLLNLGIDVDIIVKNPGELKEISEQPGARVMKKMQTGGKGGVGGVNFNSSKLNLQEKGKGIKLNSSFAAAIDPANFTGFTFKITGISRLGKAQ